MLAMSSEESRHCGVKHNGGMSRVGHGLSRALSPGFLLPSLAAGSALISRVAVGRDVGPFPASTEALRHGRPEPRAGPKS